MPSPEMISSILSFTGAIIVGYLTLAGARNATKSQARESEATRNAELINRWRDYAQYANQRTAEVEARLTARLDEQGAIIKQLQQRLSSLEERELLLRTYAEDLRNHIDRGIGPPPPPWPSNL